MWILIGASAVFTVFGALIFRRFDGEPPLMLALSLYLGGALSLGLLGIAFVYAQGGGFETVGVMMFMFCITAPAMIILGLNLSSGLALHFTQLMYHTRDADPDGYQFARAQARAVQGDTVGALREYRRYFELDPTRPAPLIAAARFAESRQDFTTAASLYRELMHKFRRTRPVWAEAALQLATLLEHRLHDVDTAQVVLREIAANASKLPQGQEAANRLARWPSGQG